jgi:hypothetical protein
VVSIEGQPTTQIDYDLAPWSSLDFETDGSGDLVSGTIEVFSARGTESLIDGVESFDVLGNFVSVPAAEARKSAQVYVSVDFQESTGVALYNPDPEQAITISGILLDSEGALVAEIEVLLGPREQLVAFVEDEVLFGGIPEFDGEFRGTLNLRSDEEGAFVVLGLLQKRSGGALIAVPTGARSFEN